MFANLLFQNGIDETSGELVSNPCDERRSILKAPMFPPLGRQSSRARRGEDGLAEAFEDRRHLRQPLTCCIHAGQQFLHLRHDSPLLSERR